MTVKAILAPGIIAIAVAAALWANTAFPAEPGTGHTVTRSCTFVGIVPGSATLKSDSTREGETSGHILRFQLCPPNHKIWNSRINPEENPLPNLLTVSWPREAFRMPADTDDHITAARQDKGEIWKPREVSSRGYIREATFSLERRDLPSPDMVEPPMPIDLQFEIAPAAGMVNQWFGIYTWGIRLHHQEGNSCGDVHAGVTGQRIISDDPGPALRVEPNSGSPGTEITIYGRGFSPGARIQGLRAGTIVFHRGLNKRWWHAHPPVEKKGYIKIEMHLPGLDAGLTELEVSVGEQKATTEITVTESAGLSPLTNVEGATERLGANLLSIFHYDRKRHSWSFYDPKIPRDLNNLTYLKTGECYWFLVEKPQEVVLNRYPRSLKCPGDGFCWNRIIW